MKLCLVFSIVLFFLVVSMVYVGEFIKGEVVLVVDGDILIVLDVNYF